MTDPKVPKDRTMDDLPRPVQPEGEGDGDVDYFLSESNGIKFYKCSFCTRTARDRTNEDGTLNSGNARIAKHVAAFHPQPAKRTDEQRAEAVGLALPPKRNRRRKEISA